MAGDGQCSLRQTITAANTDTASGAMPGECMAGSGADVINLPAETCSFGCAKHNSSFPGLCPNSHEKASKQLICWPVTRALATSVLE